MKILQDVQELAFGAADMLNNIGGDVSNEYKLGYAQGILDAIVKMTQPIEDHVDPFKQKLMAMTGPHPFSAQKE